MEEEIWKDIPGFQNNYQASNLGRVRSKDHFIRTNNPSKMFLKPGRVLKFSESKKGYYQVSLMKAPKQRFHTGIHRLVALAFIPNPNDLPQINHIDGDKKNNRLENLEWCTSQQNQIHAVKNNLVKPNCGEKHHNSKLSNVDVVKARQLSKHGMVGRQIAKLYNVTATAMSKILRNKTYKIDNL